MLQNMKLPMIALAFAGLGAGAVTTYRLTAPDGRIVACRPGATALARLELLFGMGKKEKSRIVEIWYRPSADSDTRIEAIRSAYKGRYGQESVMRVDGVSCVSF